MVMVAAALVQPHRATIAAIVVRALALPLPLALACVVIMQVLDAWLIVICVPMVSSWISWIVPSTPMPLLLRAVLLLAAAPAEVLPSTIPLRAPVRLLQLTALPTIVPHVVLM